MQTAFILLCIHVVVQTNSWWFIDPTISLLPFLLGPTVFFGLCLQLYFQAVSHLNFLLFIFRSVYMYNIFDLDIFY